MASLPKTDLFLFDIDGTLITSGGAGESSLRLAICDLFGVEDDLHDIEIAGRTDKAIARAVFQKYCEPITPEGVTRFLDHYLTHLAEQLPVRQGRRLPGILPLLEALQARPQVALALLTGNIVRGAELKLTHYGLWHYFEFGAFADDHAERNRLGPVARQRALERHGVEIPLERTYVLGDTPHDVACGRAVGAKTVAIATGQYDSEALARSNPDFLFEDLSDLPALLAAFNL